MVANTASFMIGIRVAHQDRNRYRRTRALAENVVALRAPQLSQLS